jgi:Mn2+/Fe2+ NRAMP family transporter
MGNSEEGVNIADIFAPAQFFSDPSSIVSALLSNLLLVAGIILFLLVVFAGFQMITSGGDAHKMEQWRNMLMYGIIGFVIILVAGGVIAIIETFTGVNILNPEAVLNP